MTWLPEPIPALLAAGPGGSQNVPLAMLVVFGSARLLAEICERLKQPALVGEILAGAIIGPSVLGWIAPNQVLTAFSELGVMFLLFRVGLEVKSSELMRVGPTAMLVAMLGVVAPFAAGILIMRAWGAPSVEAFFTGAAMVATSIGITAELLKTQGLLAHRASRIILAAAVIDDVLGLLVLAVVSSLAKGSVNFLELAIAAGLAIGFTLILAKWGSRTMVRVVPRVEKQLRVGEKQFNVAMVLLFALSLLAMRAGVAAIVGAFMAGMALSDTANEHVHDLATGVAELLVPFFLAGIGMQMDLTVFANPETLILSGVILLAAVLSKLVGCGLGAINLGWRNSLRVGFGMVPRGEVGLVVAQLGFGIGVISKSVYGVVVFMAVATTILAPPLLRLSFRGASAAAPAPAAQSNR